MAQTMSSRVMQMWIEFAAAPPQHARPTLRSHFGVASATDGKGKRYWSMVLGE